MRKASKRQEDILAFIKEEVRKKDIRLPFVKLVRLSGLLLAQLFMVTLLAWKAKDLFEEIQLNHVLLKF